jgi:hypothetical protein
MFIIVPRDRYLTTGWRFVEGESSRECFSYIHFKGLYPEKHGTGGTRRNFRTDPADLCPTGNGPAEKSKNGEWKALVNR